MLEEPVDENDLIFKATNVDTNSGIEYLVPFHSDDSGNIYYLPPEQYIIDKAIIQML